MNGVQCRCHRRSRWPKVGSPRRCPSRWTRCQPLRDCRPASGCGFQTSSEMGRNSLKVQTRQLIVRWKLDCVCERACHRVDAAVKVCVARLVECCQCTFRCSVELMKMKKIWPKRRAIAFSSPWIEFSIRLSLASARCLCFEGCTSESGRTQPLVTAPTHGSAFHGLI